MEKEKCKITDALLFTIGYVYRCVITGTICI